MKYSIPERLHNLCRREKGIKKPSSRWSGRLVMIDDAAAHAASFTFSASQSHH
jgi:hypothetical protein